MPKESNEDQVWISSTEVIPGAASLVQHIDKSIFVWLRDGRLFVGYLRSVDQFANLAMYPASERVQIKNTYSDIPQGILMIRGENVALLGEEGINENQRQLIQPNQLLADQVARDNHRKKFDALKELAYWKNGLVYSSDDYF